MDVFDEYLTENEEVVHTISSGGGNHLGMTNKRIIKLGHHDFKDIRYGHISSIGWKTTSNVGLLICGGVLIVGGLWILGIWDLPEIFYLFLMVGLSLIGLYFLTKRGELTIATENEKLIYPFEGSKSHTSVKEVIKTIRTLDESYYSK